MPQSYSERKKAAAVFICKAAFYTIPRFGIFAILFLCIGLFFIFPACNTYLQLQEEKLVPWELVGNTTNEDIALDKLLSIEGVARVSPVIQFDTEIQFGEYKLNCQVQAVHSTFLYVDLSEGAIFPDDSNMPFMVLNKTAAESFLSDNKTKVKVSANTSVIMELNNEATNALICGIFDDGKETPGVYMSYNFASRTYMSQSGVKLIFSLSNKGDMEQIIQFLREEGISVIYDQNELIRWNMKGQQVWQFILISISFLFCAAVLIQNGVLRSDKVTTVENYALMIAGMTMQQLKKIAYLRLSSIYIINLIIVCWISFFAGIFSTLAIIICIILLSMHFILLSAKYIN